MNDWADVLRAAQADGRFTPDFVAWLQAFVAYVKALEARIEALEP